MFAFFFFCNQMHFPLLFTITCNFKLCLKNEDFFPQATSTFYPFTLIKTLHAVTDPFREQVWRKWCQNEHLAGGNVFSCLIIRDKKPLSLLNWDERLYTVNVFSKIINAVTVHCKFILSMLSCKCCRKAKFANIWIKQCITVSLTLSPSWSDSDYKKAENKTSLKDKQVCLFSLCSLHLYM